MDCARQIILVFTQQCCLYQIMLCYQYNFTILGLNEYWVTKIKVCVLTYWDNEQTAQWAVAGEVIVLPYYSSL